MSKSGVVDTGVGVTTRLLNVPVKFLDHGAPVPTDCREGTIGREVDPRRRRDAVRFLISLDELQHCGRNRQITRKFRMVNNRVEFVDLHVGCRAAIAQNLRNQQASHPYDRSGGKRGCRHKAHDSRQESSLKHIGIPPESSSTRCACRLQQGVDTGNGGPIVLWMASKTRPAEETLRLQRPLSDGVF